MAKESQAALALLITEKELQQLTGFCHATIHRRCDAGDMPRPLKIGRSNRWRRADIIAWIDAGCPKRSNLRKGA